MGLVYLPTVVHIYIYMHCIILFPPGFSSNEKTDPTNSIQDSPVTAEAWIPRSESRGVSGDGWGIRWSENVCHLNQQKSSGGDPQQSQKWMNNEHAALQNTGCLQFFRCCLTSNRFFFFPKNIYIPQKSSLWCFATTLRWAGNLHPWGPYDADFRDSPSPGLPRLWRDLAMMFEDRKGKSKGGIRHNI